MREIGQILNYNNIEVVELNKNKIENYNLPIEIKRSNILKDSTNVQSFIENKTALVTGAAGSIGQEICTQLKNLNAKKIYCLDSNEYSLAKLKKKISL